MKRCTPTTAIRVLIILACSVLLGVSAGAQERQRGVRKTQAISGVVLQYNAYELQLRNEAGDHNIRITTQTQLKGEICVAAQVHVRYQKNDANEMVAVSVQAKPELIELYGVIEELLPDGFVAITSLGGVTVRVDEHTVILIDGALATLGDLVLGDRVEIDALPGEGEEVLALVVVTESSAIELQGRISSIGDDFLTLFCLAHATRVGLTDETIVWIYGREATIADLAVDMCAKVYATRLDDGSLQALLVDVSKGFNVDEINGIVATVSETELVVLARQGEVFTFAITPGTTILRRNEAIAATDIVPGDFVQVKAVDDVTLGAVAIRIRVEDPGLHYRAVTGVIASIDGSLLTLALPDGSEIEVLVDSRTIIRVGREKGSTADLAIGKRVEVHLWRNPDQSASAIAVKIVILDDEPGELVFKGVVAKVESGLLTIHTARIGELGFVVDDTTQIIINGAEAALTDIRPGDVVEVHAVSDGVGILTAILIDVKSTPDSDTVSEGEVVKVSSESIMLETQQGKANFAVTPATVVLIDDAPASITDVIVGDHARIEFETGEGMRTATKIEIHR